MKEVITQKKNCSVGVIPITENYCSRCGQRFTNKPTSTLSLIVCFISNFFSLEKSGFATIFKILKNPKPIVENYYSGYRRYHASPGKVLLYGIGVIVIHVYFVYEEELGVSKTGNIQQQYLFWMVLIPIFFLFPTSHFLGKLEVFLNI
ncbi:hypothetical protein ACFQ3R_10415 [Mesonia ostreae]|uniref:Uncharacterized protein n=1 Tax=Mesonia ostreae TaxID=861110 RepID=A0ABU2KGF4_9FLAO|nr:hypothetical protein [Mesonia ostreae]MDT0293792.1 hypothetical protein [Mesonia ostreae]